MFERRFSEVAMSVIWGGTLGAGTGEVLFSAPRIQSLFARFATDYPTSLLAEHPIESFLVTSAAVGMAFGITPRAREIRTRVMAQLFDLEIAGRMVVAQLHKR
jgi:hypothetical protein